MEAGMIKERQFVDFIYIGAPRSGSTWLAAGLQEHPGIWIPHNKEVHFFNHLTLYPHNYQYPKGIDYYRSYFRQAPEDAMLGDVSPLYYLDTETASRIHKHFPDTKIISILRNPVNMVYSFYLKRCTLEPREATFAKEIEKHPELLELGDYHRLLSPYFELFAEEQRFVSVYEAFFSDTTRGIKELYGFLGVEEEFKPKVIGQKINVSVTPRSRMYRLLYSFGLKSINNPKFGFLKRMLHRLRLNRHRYDPAISTYRPPPIDPRLRKRLMDHYRSEIEALEKMLAVDLTIWKASNSGANG